jgi:hypothetical protein
VLQRFDEQHTAAMKFAFERAWAAKADDYAEGDQAAFARRMLALIILQIAANGARDPHLICELALRRVSPDCGAALRGNRPQLHSISARAALTPIDQGSPATKG